MLRPVRPSRGVTTLATGLVAGLAGLVVSLVPALPGSPAAADEVTSLAAGWDATAAAYDAPLGTVVTVQGAPGSQVDLAVSLQGVRITALPDVCTLSSTLNRRSWLSADRSQLSCALTLAAPEQQVVVSGRVSAGAGTAVRGTVSAGTARATLAERAVSQTAPSRSGVRRTRLVSSPDFLNADVGNLAQGPGFWRDKPTSRRSVNAINSSYRRSLSTVLDDWVTLAPDGVLVAGDLVEGRWGEDTERTGNFGPLRTQAQREQAVRRAARTFYPQWRQRFTSRGLPVHPAVGDHELGDNDWPAAKRALAPTYREEFARAFTTSGGRPVYADRPRGPHAGTAYAFRPSPQVQVVTLDAFDLTAGRARVQVERRQLRWFEGVLRRAQRDGVRWTVVQAHPPVLGPVRSRGSSELSYAGGADSRLWRLMQAYGVDLYLAGEVHDATLAESGGVTQLTHGGLFAFGGTNYAVLDFYDDRIEVDLRDYDVRVQRDGRRLWETRAPGLPRKVVVGPAAHTIGTASITDDGLVERSGVLLPYSR